MSKGSVLLLGCGLVAPPLINYFSENDITLVVASRTLSKTEAVCKGLKNVTAAELNMESEDFEKNLEELVVKADLVISLLPYTLHMKAAKIAIKNKKHFCTTSYVSPEMQQLDDEAKKAGVILLNECGVDPGLDHMSAKKVIDEIHEKGGKLTGFYSLCGGLPAPKDNNNPLGYKLSWSPRGVLLASKNSAKFLDAGEVKSIEGIELFGAVRQETIQGLNYEWYPNRDSTSYQDIYKIPEVETLIRGTYRYKGWCETLLTIVKLNFVSLDETDAYKGKPYLQFTASVLEEGKAEEATVESVKAALTAKGVTEGDITKLQWLGLLEEKELVPEDCNTALDAMCHLMQSRMQYAEGEKDMILMKHTFEVEYSKADRCEMESLLLDYGEQPKGFSSMARTVSLPLAVAVEAVLDKRITATGVVRPVLPEVYGLILKKMEELNVKFQESTLPTHFWMRHEVKPGEERVILTPADAKKLLDAGFRVSVEKSPTRCIPDEEYKAVGCTIVPTATWMNAPKPTIIIGLKELPEDNIPLVHRHIMFAHCFKAQAGWSELLTCFKTGGGLLWDLEFLVDENKRRVAAFGYAAGVVGMAVGILTWAAQQRKEPLGTLSSWKSVEALVEACKSAVEKTGKSPTAHVVGALGRCGGGAVWFAKQCGLAPVEWDIKETSERKAPFTELIDSDILVNCIYLNKKIPPFLTKEVLTKKERKLSVFVDVSCDTSNPNNPYPIYDQGTTLADPTLRVIEESKESLPLDVVAIDHLPSLVPTSSSEEFSGLIVKHILDLKDTSSPVWKRAEDLFEEKLATVSNK